MKKRVTGAVIAAILLVAQTVPVVNSLTDFIVGLLGLGGAGALAAAISLAFGGVMDTASLNIFAENVLLYHKASDETTRLFNVL